MKHYKEILDNVQDIRFKQVASLISNYDFSYMYIEDYSQMKQAEEKNKQIEIALNEMGVKI